MARILGIDPGLGVTGYAVVVVDPVGGLIFKCSGEVKTDTKASFQKRLKVIFDRVQAIIEQEKPNAIALEATFLAKNFQSALKLGQAKGVVLLAAEIASIPVFEYSPTAIKMAVVGYGRADKWQIQQMVQRLLSLPSILKSDHQADAAAIAICHVHSAKFQERM